LCTGGRALRSVLSKQKNTEVLLGEAMDIDPQNNRLTLRDGAQVEYDSLIVSTGFANFL
jgi:NADH:ubiquinone reductase (H+-translocating)